MNINKFTQKSIEAVQNTEKLAYEYGNQQIDQEHLLLSLLGQPDYEAHNKDGDIRRAVLGRSAAGG